MTFIQYFLCAAMVRSILDLMHVALKSVHDCKNFPPQSAPQSMMHSSMSLGGSGAGMPRLRGRGHERAGTSPNQTPLRLTFTPAQYIEFELPNQSQTHLTLISPIATITYSNQIVSLCASRCSSSSRAN